jgi:predicted TIM-barrel fold metal-dependent hydrolase
MIIDMHFHGFHKSVADALNAAMRTSDMFEYPIPVFDADEYVRMLDRVKVDIGVLSVPGPVPDGLPTPEARLNAARSLNDAFAEAMARHPKRFRAFGRVPLVDPDAAVTELGRMLDDLGFQGVLLPTNVLGAPLDDPKFDPFWAEANRRRVVCFFHPQDWPCDPRWKAYGLLTKIGWPADSSLTVSRLVLSGHRDRFPDTSLVLSHLGGMIPVYLTRLNWSAGKPACAKNPEEYFRAFYYDTAGGLRAPLIKAVCELFGADQVVFGTDYPFGRNFHRLPPARQSPPLEHVYEATLREMEALDLSKAEKDKIFFRNAERLLRLRPS